MYFLHLYSIIDDLGRAVEELVTVITEQEIETTTVPDDETDDDSDIITDGDNSNSK